MVTYGNICRRVYIQVGAHTHIFPSSVNGEGLEAMTL